MVLVGTAWYPMFRAQEIGKLFMKSAPLPDYITRRGPYACGTSEGYRLVTIFECDGSRLAEAVLKLHGYYATFKEISEFRYSVDVCLEAPEGLKILGVA